MDEKTKNILDKEFGEDFLPILDNPNPEGYYTLRRKYCHHPQKYWIILNHGTKGDFAVAGCRATGKKVAIPIDFDISDLKRTHKEPKDNKQYERERRIFKTNVEKCLRFKGVNKYLHHYKKDPHTTYVLDGTLFVPFYFGKEVKAVLKIENNGLKKFLRFSEPRNAYHVVKPPLSKSSWIYLCEGIKTGYAVRRGIKKEHGVVCVGSAGNMENAIKFLKLKKGHEVIICTEKASHSHYIHLRNKYNCLLVGSSHHEDLHDFYMELGLDRLKRCLLSFQQKQYIPLGISPNHEIIVYIKTLHNVRKYPSQKSKDLYQDAHNIIGVPDNKLSTEFFWEVRSLCLQSGTIKNYMKIKEGIFPHKGLMYYYDTENLYLLKDQEIKKIDPDAVISNDLVLCKESQPTLVDLTKVDILTDKEICNFFKVFDVFNLTDFDKKLLIGWVLQSVICGGLKFRTPLWVIAPTGSGKTQLTDRVLRHFFIFYDRKTGRETTPKWIHRAFHGKASVLQRDEFDPSVKHSMDAKDEMEAVRASSTERFPERGISAGLDDTTQTFCYCFSACYTSIRKVDELSEADLARFVFLKLGRIFDEKFLEKIDAFEKLMTIKMKTRFLKTMILKMEDIKNKYNFFMAKSLFAYCGHEKSSYITLLCCYNSVFEDKITLKDIAPFIKREKPEGYSRLYMKCMNLYLRKSCYDFVNSNLTLYDFLIDDEIVLKEKGIYVRDKELLIDEKKGIRFIRQLCYENNVRINEHVLKSDLKNDGEMFLGMVNIGSVKDKIKRGKYLRFNWDKTKEELG